MRRLEGRTAIITGGSQGIGAAYVRGFAAEGSNVVVADIADAESLVAEVAANGGVAQYVETDVTSPSSCAAMADRTLERFGSIDVLVNNAALWVAVDIKPMLDIAKEEWDRVLDVNINGLFNCAQAVVPQMIRQGYGKIINISSGRALKGHVNRLHYDTSKGAVISFTRSLARELGDAGVRVNTIAPGGTMTENVMARSEVRDQIGGNVLTRAIQRDEVPEDVVGACIFLASAESDFVTGQILTVDGGSAMH